MGITAHTPHSNRTCPIKAYGLTLYFNFKHCSNWLSCPHNCSSYLYKVLSLPFTVISSFYGTMNTRTSYYPFGFLSYSLDCTSYLVWGDNRTSAVTITYLSSTSPSSPTGGCHYNLTISVIIVLSAVKVNTSTISNLIIISQLNHFTFVSALLLPVLRLNLTLPLRFQGLGTGGWLDLTW